MVIREDGTVLFTDTMHSPSGIVAVDDYSSHSPIVDTDTGAYMCLLSNGGAPNGSTRIYQLPGSLPCLDCDGVNLFVPGGGNFLDQWQVIAIPNPASQSVQLVVNNPYRNGALELQVVNVQGQIVKEINALWNSPVILNTTSFSAGRYHVRSIGLGDGVAVGSFVIAE